MRAHVAGIGLFAPGLENWSAGRRILAGQDGYSASTLAIPAPAICPPNERRRMTPSIRIALHAALQAVQDVGCDSSGIPTVFASSEGDLEVIDHLCRALALPDRPVSPTHFHNSVHNAPAGYWHLGQQAQSGSTSLSAGEASFAAGLIEALTLLEAEQAPVLLVVYDAATPAGLSALCPIDHPFGLAMILTTLSPDRREPSISIHLACEPTPASMMEDAGLEALRLGNPAARALPLLRALAGTQPMRVDLPYLDGANISIEVVPCA